MVGAPVVHGECDCLMVLANWVRELTGVDPAPELRGSYSTEQEWRDIVAAAGSMAALVAPLARRAGLRLVHGAPVDGDIAVVRKRGTEFGGIRYGRGWLLKINSALTVVRAEPLVMWRLPACP